MKDCSIQLTHHPGDLWKALSERGRRIEVVAVART